MGLFPLPLRLLLVTQDSVQVLHGVQLGLALADHWESIMDAASIKTAHFVDAVCLAVAYILPLLIVLRWNLRGVFLGTLVFWGLLAAAGPLISQLDPSRLEGGTAMLDTIWLLGGWIMGLFYCLLIYGAKRLICSCAQYKLEQLRRRS
jgi:hypothetical protein